MFNTTSNEVAAAEDILESRVQEILSLLRNWKYFANKQLHLYPFHNTHWTFEDNNIQTWQVGTAILSKARGTAGPDYGLDYHYGQAPTLQVRPVTGNYACPGDFQLPTVY